MINYTHIAALLIMTGCAYQASTNRYPPAPEKNQMISDDTKRTLSGARQKAIDKQEKAINRDRINRDLDRLEHEIKMPLIRHIPQPSTTTADE